MSYFAVITGDLTNSRLLAPTEKKQAIDTLKACFTMLHKKRNITFEKEFEIFRGDSFQCVLRNPANALRVALIIRTCLIKQKILIQTKVNSTSKKTEPFTDARIAIGIGNVNFKSRKVVESDGEAFQQSGMLIDSMKSNGKRLMIGVPGASINASIQMHFNLLDFIVSKWTAQQCEAIYEILTNNVNQQKLSQKLKVSQPSIHQRLKISGWYVIAPFITFYESQNFSAA
jgi:hypothetical protein